MKICQNCDSYNRDTASNCLVCGNPFNNYLCVMPTINSDLEYDNNEYESEDDDNYLRYLTHDFEESKYRIKEYSENYVNNISFSPFPTNGGLFGLFDHKVTGEEMNEYTGKLQSYLIYLNNVSLQTIKEFNSIYNAFESLDSDYIQYFNNAIDAIQDNTQGIEKNQDDISKTIDALKLTIQKLKEFKNNIEGISNLYNIDFMFNQIQNIESTMESNHLNTIEVVKQLNKRIIEVETSRDTIKGQIDEQIIRISELISSLKQVGSRVKKIEKFNEKISNKLDATFKKSEDNTNAIKEHDSSLEQIIKLPEKTFDEGITTSIFIFESGTPQNNEEIFTCYIVEDGLERVKNQGRQDVRHRWKDIEDKWVEIIKKQTGDRSIKWIKPNEHLSYQKDEMPFSVNEEDFIKTMTDYLMFKEEIDVKTLRDTISNIVIYDSTISDNEENHQIEISIDRGVTDECN